MTDEEKIRAEIERRKKEVIDNIFELGNSESERIGLFDRKELYNDLLSFIDSMPKRQVFILKGEIKDAPIADTGDYEVFLDYCRDEYENILDKICDYVNEKYSNDIDRYKVTVQITIDKEV